MNAAVATCSDLAGVRVRLGCGGDLVSVLLLCVSGMQGSSRGLQVGRGAPL